MEKSNCGRIHSIDDSAYWSGISYALAVQYRLISRINYFIFPLGIRIYKKEMCISYKVPESFYQISIQYDLVLIDAPHHDVGRDGCLFESFPHLRTGGYFICDDCNSRHMQKTLKRWQERFPQSLKIINVYRDIGNGIGIIQKVEDCLNEPLFSSSRFVVQGLRALRNYWRVKKIGLNTRKGLDGYLPSQ